MPPHQPLLSEQAAFAQHLFVQGYPLWNPSPDLLPPARQNDGLSIGDIGVVDEQGRFDVFFNIHEPLPGSAIPKPNFPTIEFHDVRCEGGDLLPREVVSSPTTSWRVEQLDVPIIADSTRMATQYSSTLCDDGAHIILPRGAQLFELSASHQQLFENYAREHGLAWLDHFKDRLQAARSNSLYVLTGFYKTSSWSIASFSMQRTANSDPVYTSCTLVEAGGRTMRDDSVWQPAGRFGRKIGPPPDRQGRNNQTIFVRGITITPNLSQKSQGEQQMIGLLDKLFSPTRFLNSLALDSAKVTDAPQNNVIIQRVPQTSQASHPSEIINHYLLAKEPSAKIAVTHDKQWIAMLKLAEAGMSLMLEDLENYVEAVVPSYYSIVTHNDTVYLRENQHAYPGTEESALLDDPHPSDPHVHSDVTGGSPSHTMNLSPDQIPRPAVSGQLTPTSVTTQLTSGESSGPYTPPQNAHASLPLPDGPVAIHSVLSFHPFVPPIIYDTSFPPNTLAPNVHASSLSLPARVLEEPATQPSMHTITLITDHFPWRLVVPPAKHYISVRDLLEALYLFLRQPVLPSEYNALPTQALKDEVSIAFHARCGRAPSKEAADEQYKKGVKRVDFLRGRTRFMGLSSTKVGPDVWVLNLA